MHVRWLVIPLVLACGTEEEPPEDGLRQLRQALGLGQAGTGPNGLGSTAIQPNGLGAQSAGQVRPGAAPGGGANPGGEGQPPTPASCATACDKIINCGLIPNDGSCVPQCQASIGAAGAEGQAALECVTTASCSRIQSCL